MRILYVGDVMGEMGMAVVERLLPAMRRDKNIDVVIAQAENVTEGRGINLTDFERLKRAGVDFCTGGNWSLHREEIIEVMNNSQQPIIRPANYPADTPGLGYKYITVGGGKVLVISLLGKIVGRDADKPIDNPLQTIDRILDSQKDVERAATIVNFHGDFSSEKVVIGYYLDGKVSVVIGDHWHVPTADAQILPNGTAHQTDVGMCGSLDSSLGVTFSSVIPRWHDDVQTRNVLETAGRQQFNAVLVEVDINTGLAISIEPIHEVLA